MKPRLLDAFCRKGGAGMGYIRAGFDVVGVDIEDHAAGYPGEFVQGDAVQFIRDHGHEFDAIHASPPCQNEIAITAGNRARAGWEDRHVDWVTPTRQALHALNVPSVIENGRSAKSVRPDVVLCGLQFGLPTLRHRSFELHGWSPTVTLGHAPHRGHLTIGWRHGCRRTVEPSVCPKHGHWCKGTVYGVYGKGGGKPSVTEAQKALGIDWMDSIDDLNEAIPPAFTYFLGSMLRVRIELGRAA